MNNNMKYQKSFLGNSPFDFPINDRNRELMPVSTFSRNILKCMCTNQKEQCLSIKHLCVCNIYPTFCKARQHIYCVCKYNPEHCKANNPHDCSCKFLREKCKSDTHQCICKSNHGKCQKKYIHECVCTPGTLWYLCVHVLLYRSGICV